MKKETGRIYAILKKNRVTKDIEGYVEHSFSMGWDTTRVRVWREWELSTSFKDGKVKQLFDWMPKVDKKKYKLIFVRINSKKSPITVEMDSETQKFYWRNKKFKVINN